MNSMTGYGRGEQDNGHLKMVVEVKAVNNRYSEILVKQPRQYLALEDAVKKLCEGYVERGRVEVFVQVQEISEQRQISNLNQEKAIAYHQGLKALSEQLGEIYQFDVYRLVNLPEVIVQVEKEDDLKVVWQVLESALTEAMSHLMVMRVTEGAAIKADLVAKIKGLEVLVAQIAERSPIVLNSYLERLRGRITELLSGAIVENERLEQEVAFFAEKSCIDEEVVRLSSHFQQFKEIADAPGSIGRKLDFLIQEMNRETNTIGSKANDLIIGRLVVEMKSELEKIREQVQNIE